VGSWWHFEVRAVVHFSVGRSEGYVLYELAPFFVLGVMGGLLGALFTSLNLRIVKWRRRRINRRRYMQVLEVVMLALVVSAIFFTLPEVCSGC